MAAQAHRIADVGVDASRAAGLSLALLAVAWLGVALLLASVLIALLPLGAAVASLLTGVLALGVGLGGLWAIRRRRS